MEKSIATRRHRELAALVQRRRRDPGVTQEALAGRLEVTQSVIRKVESGQRRLDLVQLDAYCRTLGVSLVELIER